MGHDLQHEPRLLDALIPIYLTPQEQLLSTPKLEITPD